MNETQRAAQAAKARDRANRSTVRQVGTVVSVSGSHAVVNVGIDTIPAVIPSSVLGVVVGATVRIQRGNTSVIESVLGRTTTGVGAKVVRATAGPSVASSTWTKLAGFTSKPYDDANIVDQTTGIVTIPFDGRWTIGVTCPWPHFGSVFTRTVGAFLGTSKIASSLGAIRTCHNGRSWQQLTVKDYFTAGQQITVWMWSDTASAGPDPTDDAAPPSSITVELGR